jgi:hypothetical protein
MLTGAAGITISVCSGTSTATAIGTRTPQYEKGGILGSLASSLASTKSRVLRLIASPTEPASPESRCCHQEGLKLEAVWLMLVLLLSSLSSPGLAELKLIGISLQFGIVFSLTSLEEILISHYNHVKSFLAQCHRQVNKIGIEREARIHAFLL